ncbi:MAG: glycerate kinase [Clostridiales bacterium]|jgi:glycerate kinase|nr:glycerate kinase [Clostridiales bacterium]
MKVVVALDSFKGCITSKESSKFVADGVLAVYPDAEVVTINMADGGEGFLEPIVNSLKGIIRTVQVTGPLGESVQAKYGFVPESKTAVIELAEAAGLNLVPMEARNPLYTTTYGVGEIIVDAIEQGCRKFIVGIGGSATNDAGMGMLQALGYEFLGPGGQSLGLGGHVLNSLVDIRTENVHPELANCEFRVACDVDNPLFGPKGAAHAYAVQKGASPDSIKHLDAGLVTFSNVVKRVLKKTISTAPGAGAAGGVGYAFLAFLRGKLEPGANIVKDATKLEENIKTSDIVITGEGKIDASTVRGKAPFEVTKLAKQYNKKVIALAGIVSDDIAVCNEQGIDAIFCIQRGPIDSYQAMEIDVVTDNLKATVTQIFKLIKSTDGLDFGKK